MYSRALLGQEGYVLRINPGTFEGQDIKNTLMKGLRREGHLTRNVINQLMQHIAALENCNQVGISLMMQ